MNTSTTSLSTTTARMLRLAQTVDVDGAPHFAVLNTDHATLIRDSGLVRQTGRHWVLTDAGIAARDMLM